MKAIFLLFALCAFAVSDDLYEIPIKRMKSGFSNMLEKRLDQKFIKKLLLNSEYTVAPPTPKEKDNDTIPLFKYMDSEFYGEIGIGHPAQPFKVIFDTAWANSWVPSSTCSPFAHPACAIKNKYDSQRSGSFQYNGTIFSVNGTSLSGILSTDNINMGHIKIRNQTFAELSSIPISFLFSDADGVFGMAMSSFSIDGVTPFFYNIIKQGIIKSPIFSFYMNRASETEKGGSLFLGGSDPKHYTGSFTHLAVEGNRYWMFRMDEISMVFGGRVFSVCKGGCSAYADTSNMNIAGPPDEISTLNRYIYGKYVPYLKKYVVDCDIIDVLPHVNFTMGGRNFTLKGGDYTQQISKGPISLCLSAFVPLTMENKIWALGGAFLTKFYVEYNMADNSIGFADCNL